MLRELIQLFEKQYGKDPENWLEPVLATYRLDKGIYVRINPETINYDRNNDVLIVRKDFYDGEQIIDSDLHQWFVQRDFYSSVPDKKTNNCISLSKKAKIWSINPLSFFAKLIFIVNEKKISGQINQEAIDVGQEYREYFTTKEYEDFALDVKKYTNIFSKILSSEDNTFKSIHNEINKISSSNANEKKLDSDKLAKKLNDEKLYIKFFLDCPIEDYSKISYVHIRKKLFHNNTKLEEWFVPRFNLTLNPEKPFLKLLANNLETPYFLLEEDAIKLRLIGLWLKNQPKPQLNFAYDYCFDVQSSNFTSGYFVSSKGFEIIDFDNIPMISKSKTNQRIYECFDSSDYEDIGVAALEKKIELFFPELDKLWLKDILINESWVDLYNKLKIGIVARVLLPINKKPGKEPGKELLNLLFSIEGEEKVNEIREVKNTFRKMITEINTGSRTELDCDSDIFYFFVAGQCVYFLLSKSKQSNKAHDLLLPFIQTKSSKQLKLLLRTYFKKYSHELFLNNIRVNLTFEMLLSYESNSSSMKGFEDVFMAGYFADNSLFVQKDRENLMEKV